MLIGRGVRFDTLWPFLFIFVNQVQTTIYGYELRITLHGQQE